MTDETPASITVRDATPEDRPQLVGFMAELNAYEHALQPDRALGEKAADAHLAYLEALVARQRGFVLVAEESGGVQGFLLGIVEEEDGSYVIPEARPYGYVTDLFISEIARGRGVGRALGEKAADAHLAYLESLVARQRGFVLVAEESGGVQGFLLGIVEEEDGSYVIPEARPYGYVTDLFITEIARGRGVGRALMAEAERRFRDAGLPSIRVTALAANEGACGTYEGLGYQHHAITFIKPLDQD